jgi:hypothetical protein
MIILYNKFTPFVKWKRLYRHNLLKSTFTCKFCHNFYTPFYLFEMRLSWLKRIIKRMQGKSHFWRKFGGDLVHLMRFSAKKKGGGTQSTALLLS